MAEKKLVKIIRVNLDLCNGCRACEMACSAFHANPKYSIINPARSRIRVTTDEINDEYVPVRATDYAKAACDGRRIYTVNGKQYSECSFCGSVCPVRDLFKEPDSGIPLKCDMCEDEPPLEEPMCVQACSLDALTYEEVEEEAVEEIKIGDVELGLRALIDKYGMQELKNAIVRLSQKS